MDIEPITSTGSRAFTTAVEPIGTRSADKCFDVVTEGTERFLVAARELNAGEVLFDRVGGKVMTRRTRHSIQIGEGKHITVENEADLINHSCSPNCTVEIVEGLDGHVS